jgi:hypothetical protein
MAQEFNDYFINVVGKNDINEFCSKQSDNNSDNNLNSSCNLYSLTCNSYSIFMPPTTPADIFTIINSLKNTSSVGYDDISTNILKKVGHIIAPMSNTKLYS